MDVELKKQLFENSKYGQAQKAINAMTDKNSKTQRIQLADGRVIYRKKVEFIDFKETLGKVGEDDSDWSLDTSRYEKAHAVYSELLKKKYNS